MRKYFLVLSLLAFLSCKRVEGEPFGLNFYFENPQPINDAELSKIPNKFHGLFMSSDSIYVNIHENIILKEYYSKFRFLKKDFDSIKGDFDRVGSNYISKLNQDVYEAKFLKDSIEFSTKKIDTFFIFSNKQKVKRFNGQLVLNCKDSIFWTVKLMRLENNKLNIKYIYSDEDLKRIDSLTRIKSTRIDSSSFIIKPSRNEFKRILNLKKLGEDMVYKKMQNN